MVALGAEFVQRKQGGEAGKGEWEEEELVWWMSKRRTLAGEVVITVDATSSPCAQ